MKVLENEEKQQKNIFIDKLTSDKDINKSMNKSEICDFNLEYQKYKVPPDNHVKLKEEFQKLIKFVKESNLYRDIYGNKITKKGKLLLTPFQRIRKLNDEIKTYYENKCNKKTSQLIIKNYSTKDKNQYTNFLNNERKKVLPMKKYNIIKIKKSKMNEFKEKHYLTMNKLYLEINPEKEMKNIIKNKLENEANNYRKKNFLCLSNTSNNFRNKYFNVHQYNQINFRKAKILKPNSMNKKNNFDIDLSIVSKYKNYLTSRNLIEKNDKNKNNEKTNSLRKTINIKKINRNKSLIESKTADDNLDKYKYKLIQFNLNQLIKPSLKYKDKVVLNAKDDLTNIKKKVNNDIKKEENLIETKIKKNKIINVNMTPYSYNLNY